jgi:hypothetical protein
MQNAIGEKMNIKKIVFLMCLVFCMTSLEDDVPHVYLCSKCDISVIKAKKTKYVVLLRQRKS